MACVLVVDDTPYVLQVVADILTEGGAKVTAVDSAEEALAALLWERPDVLLSDLAMPGKDGVLADPADSSATAGAWRRHLLPPSPPSPVSSTARACCVRDYSSMWKSSSVPRR
jgi:hypothetical protein